MGPEDHEEVEAASILMLLNEDDEKLRLERVERENREHQQIWAANPLPQGRRTDAKPGLGREQHKPIHFSQAWPLGREPFAVKYIDGYDPEDTEGEEESERSVHLETALRVVALR